MAGSLIPDAPGCGRKGRRLGRFPGRRLHRSGHLGGGLGADPGAHDGWTGTQHYRASKRYKLGDLAPVGFCKEEDDLEDVTRRF